MKKNIKNKHTNENINLLLNYNTYYKLLQNIVSKRYHSSSSNSKPLPSPHGIRHVNNKIKFSPP